MQRGSSNRPFKGEELMTKKLWYTLVTTALSLAICTGGVPVSAQETFYKGKTIRIIAGFPSGGGVDAEARL